MSNETSIMKINMGDYLCMSPDRQHDGDRSFYTCVHFEYLLNSDLASDGQVDTEKTEKNCPNLTPLSLPLFKL